MVRRLSNHVKQSTTRPTCYAASGLIRQRSRPRDGNQRLRSQVVSSTSCSAARAVRPVAPCVAPWAAPPAAAAAARKRARHRLMAEECQRERLLQLHAADREEEPQRVAPAGARPMLALRPRAVVAARGEAAPRVTRHAPSWAQAPGRRRRPTAARRRRHGERHGGRHDERHGGRHALPAAAPVSRRRVERRESSASAVVSARRRRGEPRARAAAGARAAGADAASSMHMPPPQAP
jgi:hypothetical protein